MTHSHAIRSRAHSRRLVAVFVITLVVFGVELVGGALANSLALMADAGHMLTDVAGIGLALLAIWFARRPATTGRTFGFLRLEILAAVVNAVLLFGVAGLVLIEAWRGRLAQPEAVDTRLMLVIALVGLIANSVSLRCSASRNGRASTCAAPTSRSSVTSPVRSRSSSRPS